MVHAVAVIAFDERMLNAEQGTLFRQWYTFTNYTYIYIHSLRLYIVGVVVK